MSHSGRLLVAILTAASLAGCTSDPGPGESAPPPSPSDASQTTDDVDAQAEPRELRCEQPPDELVDEAATAIAPHPGPVRAATLVRAARTGTGTWYVIGIDRTYVRDDGSSDGDASRSLALTDAPAGSTFIPIANGDVGRRLTISWDDVSWTGDRRIAGERALDAAVDCLDEASGS